MATINPREADHSRRLINEMQGAKWPSLSHVIYFSPETPTDTVPQKAVALNVGLLHLVLALIDADLAPELTVVTENAQAVDDQESVNCCDASLWGLAQTVAAEYPELNCRRIDVTTETKISHLLAELQTKEEPMETQVAIRHKERYVARLSPHHEDREPIRQAQGEQPDQLPIKTEGSYLLTGGLGGIGLQVAQQIAAEGARHLVLAGRRGVSSKEAQDVILQLEEAGTSVHVIQADVTVESEVAQLLAACPKPLHGIIHLAGVLDDGVLSRQTVTRFENVMAPKVNGAWHLHHLTQDVALDFFVCFSSNASLLENGGQGNYVAANAFLDGLMQQRCAMGLPGLSINWGAWADVGMAADLIQQMQLQGLDAIPLDVGREIASALIARNMNNKKSQIGQIAAMPVNWTRYLSRYASVPPFLAKFLEKQTASTNGSSIMLRSQLEKAMPRERSQRIIVYLQEEISKVLMLSRPPAPQQGFLEMGMDSLMIVEFRNRLQSALDMKLPSTLLFKYPSLEELTEHLLTLITPEQETAEQPRETEEPSFDSESLSTEDMDTLIAEKFHALTEFLED